jgi:hypothetical protein
MTVRAIALAIVRRYPKPWRDRYEGEVSALIEDSDVRVRDLGELVRGLVTERTRELLSDDVRPKRTAAVLNWMPAIFIALLTAAAAGAGLMLRVLANPLPPVAGVTVLALVNLTGVVVYTLLVLRGRRNPQARQWPAWLTAVVVSSWFGLTVLIAWGGISNLFSSDLQGWARMLQCWVWAVLLMEMATKIVPGRQMLQALTDLNYAEEQIQMNEAWVRSCHEWIAKGVPSPLAQAESQVERYARERDDARERLARLSYRARFRGREAT